MNEKNQTSSYIYFIESYEANKNYNSPFIERVNEIDPPKIELLKENTLTESNGLKYKYKIYKFNANKRDKQFEISILQKDENNNIFEGKIFYDMVKGNFIHFFLYNFKFTLITKNGIFGQNISPSNFYYLSEENQFLIYLKYIESKYKRIEKENIIKDLIISSQNLFTGKEARYKFLFYLTIFTQCFKTNLLKRHLHFFHLERIIKVENIKNKEKINEFKIIINSINSNPKKISVYLDAREKSLLFHLIFYFNYNFQMEKLNKMLDDANINVKIFKFISQNSHFLPNLKLSLEKINYIIKECDSLNEIKNILFYSKDCYDILYIINKNKEIILEKLNKEKEIENITIKKML